MRHRSYKRSLIVAAAVALVGCADVPPLPPPKIERLTGAALAAKIPAPVAVMSTDDIVALAQCWPGHANCWPPHAGFPYWRCY